MNNQDTQANDQLPASVDSGVGPDGQTRSNSDVSGSQSDKAAGGHAGSSNLSSSDKSVGTDDPPGREGKLYFVKCAVLFFVDIVYQDQISVNS